MVFMQVELEQESYAARHIREMKRVGGAEGLNIVVQYRNFIRESQRLVVSRGRAKGEVTPDSPGGRGPKALGAFMRWAAQTYPARRYMLVLWGHSYGLRFGHDDRDAIQIDDLAKVLRTFKRRRGDRRLDVLGFNSCTMSYAEAVYELRDGVDFMIAPQAAMPLAGWPYQTILAKISKRPSIRPAELGAAIVRDVVRSYKRRHVAMTMLDLRQGHTIGSGVGRLAAALARANRRRERRREIDAAFQETTSYKGVRPLVDLADLCANLEKHSRDRRVRRAAVGARQQLRARPGGLIRAHASRGRSLKRLHGIGIYARHVTGWDDWRSLRIGTDRYKNLDLNKLTQWGQVTDTLREKR